MQVLLQFRAIDSQASIWAVQAAYGPFHDLVKLAAV
jgi:hypothetical protein